MNLKSQTGSTFLGLLAATVVVGGAMAGYAILLKQSLNASVDLQLSTERDELVKLLASYAHNPDYLARTAALNPIFKACYDWNNTNTASNCRTNLPQPDGSFSPAPTSIAFFDPTGRQIAGTGSSANGRLVPSNPIRYGRNGQPCAPGAAASSTCFYEVTAYFTAICPPAANTVTPAATCVRTGDVQVQFVVNQSSARLPAQLFPIKNKATNDLSMGWTPTTGSCPQGFTMTGIDKSGYPVCIVKTSANCPAGTFLYAFDPSTTNNNVQCRSIAAVCPQGWHWQGLNKNNSNVLINSTTGDAPGYCVLDHAKSCTNIGKPIGFVTKVDFNQQTVDCAMPNYLTCGQNMVQQGNNPDGSPICIFWTSALPTENTRLYNINDSVTWVTNAFTNMRQDACRQQPPKGIRTIGAFSNNWKNANPSLPPDGYPLCNHPPSDYNGDDIPDLVVGAGKDGGPRVEVLSGAGNVDNYNPLANFFAYDPNLRMGVVVGLTDVDGDGLADVLTLPNTPGGGPDLGIFYGPDWHNNNHRFVIDTTGNLRCGWSVGP